jgi:hypothetical protein
MFFPYDGIQRKFSIKIAQRAPGGLNSSQSKPGTPSEASERPPKEDHPPPSPEGDGRPEILTIVAGGIIRVGLSNRRALLTDLSISATNSTGRANHSLLMTSTSTGGKRRLFPASFEVRNRLCP